MKCHGRKKLSPIFNTNGLSHVLHSNMFKGRALLCSWSSICPTVYMYVQTLLSSTCRQTSIKWRNVIFAENVHFCWYLKKATAASIKSSTTTEFMFITPKYKSKTSVLIYANVPIQSHSVPKAGVGWGWNKGYVMNKDEALFIFEVVLSPGNAFTNTNWQSACNIKHQKSFLLFSPYTRSITSYWEYMSLK